MEIGSNIFFPLILRLLSDRRKIKRGRGMEFGEGEIEKKKWVCGIISTIKYSLGDYLPFPFNKSRSFVNHISLGQEFNILIF